MWLVVVWTHKCMSYITWMLTLQLINARGSLSMLEVICYNFGYTNLHLFVFCYIILHFIWKILCWSLLSSKSWNSHKDKYGFYWTIKPPNQICFTEHKMSLFKDFVSKLLDLSSSNWLGLPHGNLAAARGVCQYKWIISFQLFKCSYSWARRGRSNHISLRCIN